MWSNSCPTLRLSENQNALSEVQDKRPLAWGPGQTAFSMRSCLGTVRKKRWRRGAEISSVHAAWIRGPEAQQSGTAQRQSARRKPWRQPKSVLIPHRGNSARPGRKALRQTIHEEKTFLSVEDAGSGPEALSAPAWLSQKSIPQRDPVENYRRNSTCPQTWRWVNARI